MIFFCPSCFKKIEYKLTKPAACPFCNSSTAAGGGKFKISQAKGGEDSGVAATGEERAVKRVINRGKSRVRARAREEGEEDDYNDEDGEFSNPDWQPGYFSTFFNTSRASLKEFGVEVEKPKVSSVSMRELFPEEAEKAGKERVEKKKRGRPSKKKQG